MTPGCCLAHMLVMRSKRALWERLLSSRALRECPWPPLLSATLYIPVLALTPLPARAREVLPLISARPEHPRALGQRGGVKPPGGEGCWDTLSQEESNCAFSSFHQ